MSSVPLKASKLPTSGHLHMSAKKGGRRPSSRSTAHTGSSMNLVYGVGVVLTLGFLWVVWPFITDSIPGSDQEKQARRLERDNPDAEVFTLQDNGAKKKP